VGATVSNPAIMNHERLPSGFMVLNRSGNVPARVGAEPERHALCRYPNSRGILG